MTHTPIMLEVAFEPGKSIVIGDGERGIAIIPNDGGQDEQIRKGNACLIAAAPEMLEALETMVEMVEEGLYTYDVIDEAKAVIKKARGEEWRAKSLK